MLKGLICPSNRQVTFDQCLNECEVRCMPYPLAYKIVQDNIHDEHKGEMISASALTGCIRKVFLERTRDYCQSLANLWFAARGTWMHSVLEDLWEDHENWIVERRFFKHFDDFVVSGKIDCYSIKEKTLYDYKTTMSKTIERIKIEGVKKEHRAQTSIYKYLMDLPVEKIKIVYMSMAGVYTADCEPYPEEMIERFIIRKGSLLYKAFKSGEAPEMPDPRPEWLCNYYCPVNLDCENIR